MLYRRVLTGIVYAKNFLGISSALMTCGCLHSMENAVGDCSKLINFRLSFCYKVTTGRGDR